MATRFCRIYSKKLTEITNFSLDSYFYKTLFIQQVNSNISSDLCMHKTITILLAIRFVHAQKIFST
ncbi:hypothetical protein XBFM1_1720012 [Xenorhabdus bovienii str. feltiae Moldova]|uniref:Uncharacterized protein n=1 Tax=Xenorhabdus bovienii str. feltiae Moldova TaxID=1398200 RepID=A0A077NPV8_XENBV|nr:hypothetical protein XBFM1_1720012 [Xenorhabdus bovienii str. feltiae Moldova]